MYAGIFNNKTFLQETSRNLKQLNNAGEKNSIKTIVL